MAIGASFLVRPAEGIERVNVYIKRAIVREASFLVRPAEGIERLLMGVRWSSPVSRLHSWYDPQRVLKGPRALASLRYATLLHSWYDPQRVLKVSGDPASDGQNHVASFLVRPAEGIERVSGAPTVT